MSEKNVLHVENVTMQFGVDFYWMGNDMLDEEVDSKQRLYDMYKNEPADKLRKILDNGSYTDECRAVIKKILSER